MPREGEEDGVLAVFINSDATQPGGTCSESLTPVYATLGNLSDNVRNQACAKVLVGMFSELQLEDVAPKVSCLLALCSTHLWHSGPPSCEAALLLWLNSRGSAPTSC